MLTYTQRRNFYGKFTKNTTTTHLNDGDTLMNEAEKSIVNKRAWDFTQRTVTRTTVESQQFYNMHANYRRLIGEPYITVGTTKYVPTQVMTRAEWDVLNSSSDSSTIPEYFFIFNNQIGFYPTPSTAGYTITLPIEIQAKALSVADYTTGTVTTATNADETITFSGTTLTAGMVGKYLKIDDDNSATSGDNEWYEIDSVTDTTHLELTIPYDGTSISGGSQTYAIGQMSILPDGYDLLPVYKASSQYWAENENVTKAKMYKDMYDEGLADLIKDRSMKTSNPSFGNVEKFSNPNLYPNSIS